QPDLVISAGFLKLVGDAFLAAFGGRCLNTHNTLLPAFPGIHGPRDALVYVGNVTGATLCVAAAGGDTGAIDAPVAALLLAEREQLVEWVGRLAREGFRVEGRRVVLGSGS